MSATTTGVRDFIEDLGRTAQVRGVPQEVAQKADRATLRALGHLGLSARDRARVRAYHAGVVRRESVRSRAGSPVAARFIAAAVIQDLRSSGRSDDAVFEELRRGWSDKLPADLLEQLGRQMCA